jgi:thymidylate synthase
LVYCHIWDGDAYKKYTKETEKIIDAYKELSLIGTQPEFDKMFKSKDSLEPLSKEEFINKVKNDYNFGKKWGELGPIYGKQWRRWGGLQDLTDKDTIYLDQITNLIHDLKKNPDSRRLMVNAWNTQEIHKMVLPPCHYGFQVYTRELSIKERFEFWEKMPDKDVMDFPIGELTDDQYHNVLTQIGVPERSISLMYNTRSQDVPLGTPFNIASYALLLEIIGKMVNMVPDELISNMGDCHIYLNQVDGIKEQLTRKPFDLPKLNIDDSVNFGGSIDDFLNSCTNSNFKLIDYKSHPTIKMPLSN